MAYFTHGYEGQGRRKKSPVEMIVRVAVIVILVVLVNRWILKREQAKPPGDSGTPAEVAAVDEAERQQIRQWLTPATQPAAVDGIAVAILVDTSGSMNERVRDGHGQSVVKMAAAQKAVIELVKTTDRLQRQRLKLPVMLGIYEFSERKNQPVRAVIPLGPADPSAAAGAIAGMEPGGGTPIGEAILRAKVDLDQTGMTRQHILVVTDGANTSGFAPQAVLAVMNEQADAVPAAVYFVAFDIEARQFDPIKGQGGTVLPAADADALRQTLDSILTERILVE